MKTDEIIHALQNIDFDMYSCDPIEAKENMHIIVQEACERLALLEKEKKACFRLGQMDVIESFFDMIEAEAFYVLGRFLIPFEALRKILSPCDAEVFLTHD